MLRACENLHRRGRQVMLVTRHPDVFKRRLETDLPILQFQMRNEADIGSVIRMSGLFRNNADVIIPTRVRDYWLAGMAARLARVPVLLRLGVVRRLRDDYMMDKLRYGKFPSGILVNAIAIRETLSQTPWINPKNIHVIYNGVDAPGFTEISEKQKIRKELEIPDDHIFIVGAGRLAIEKRWGWIADALPRIQQSGLQATAIVFGEGSERPIIEHRIREHGLETEFLLPGHRSDIDKIFGAADIVALPSSNEGVSNVMLEAMGRGTMVVATDSGGAREKFTDGENILLAGNNDFDGFADRLLRAASSADLRRTIGANSFETVQNHFTWLKMIYTLEELLIQIAGNK